MNFLSRWVRKLFGYRRTFVSFRLTEIASNGRAYEGRSMIVSWGGKGTWLWSKKTETATFVIHASAIVGAIFTNAKAILSLEVTDRYSRRMGLMLGPMFVPFDSRVRLDGLPSIYVEPGCTITVEVWS